MSRSLSRGGDAQVRIGEAIKLLSEEAAASKVRASKQASARKKKRPSPEKAKQASAPMELPLSAPRFSVEREQTLSSLTQLLTDRHLLPTASDLRQVYILAGGKGSLPKSRQTAVSALLALLNITPERSYQEALEAMRTSDFKTSNQEDYARWFNLIRPSKGEKD